MMSMYNNGVGLFSVEVFFFFNGGLGQGLEPPL